VKTVDVGKIEKNSKKKKKRTTPEIFGELNIKSQQNAI